MSLAEIEAAIPHRPPFLFLDEVVERDSQHIVCRKTFRPDEFYYPGHYPHFPITPGVLLCEAAMQAGAVLMAERLVVGEDRVPVVTKMTDVRFKRMVKPGETIDIDVTLNDQMAGHFFLSGKISCGGKLAARLEFAFTLAPAEKAD